MGDLTEDMRKLIMNVEPQYLAAQTAAREVIQEADDSATDDELSGLIGDRIREALELGPAQENEFRALVWSLVGESVDWNEIGADYLRDTRR